VEVKRGEAGDPGKLSEAVFLIQVGIDVIHYPVDPLEVLFSGLLLEIQA
jgi:hypothetical protein